MSNDSMKKQESNKAGTYTSTGFRPAPKPQPKPITLWDIVTGKK